MINYLDKYFKIYERKSSIFNEVKSGTIAFLTMSYIITLNPQILEKGGYDKSYTILATIFVTCASTFLCGVLANIPFGIAPGLGLSKFVKETLSPFKDVKIYTQANCQWSNLLKALLKKKEIQGNII